ncbi:protein EXORDIUM-like 5 [Amborella trichopoda]|uniref:Phosphate-induced protein 1 n=1 Tax=Amborella trichopoda TaxID=13333 RepID=U5CY35_AMBTC|nr:protein EXORDIUM-like 5 [Amborella trichopoda]ERN14895.1 hypothetical protein AMTR_s00032p00170290 [Amborella trichopoda]|eukprot:XP_006853428.1 protein EXORDIUM-like 5 [Amborella trichopoda]
MLGAWCHSLFLLLLFFFSFNFKQEADAQRHSESHHFGDAKALEQPSELLNLEYHMGPVLSSPIKLYIIWYGFWNPSHQSIIRDFLLSLSFSGAPSPSVSEWWRTISLYTDQTGASVTRDITLAGEISGSSYSHGTSLTRLMIQSVIEAATSRSTIDTKGGLYLVLTSADVEVQDFCRAVCGFHYFTFPAIVGSTVPYAWVGYSGAQCPTMCAYPFALPSYMDPPSPRKGNVMGPPNGDVGVDGMVSVIGHELAEMASNPLINAWYAGDDPTAPTEIADVCVGVFGSGGGGGYVGVVSFDSLGRAYNVNGVKGRRFLVQWIWNREKSSCYGPNAIN